jgi:hypothetical protein
MQKLFRDVMSRALRGLAALRDGGEIVSVRLCRFAMVPKVKSVGFGLRRLNMLVRRTSLPYI